MKDPILSAEQAPSVPAGFHLGASYYPEHWTREQWPGHIRAMADLGFTIVRMLEFSWSRLEPQQGRYDFGWVDEAANLCRDAGLVLMLGTPTAAPPPWLTLLPDVLPVDAEGRRRRAGGRRHYCLHSPAYRDAARGVVENLAAHVADRDDVVAWQVDNEVGSYRTTFCYCERCEVAFRTWLQRRYGSLQALNEAWGTIFWSAELSTWGQIEIPSPARVSASSRSPLLDFWRFSSEALADFVGEQADILRAHTPHVPVTTNWTGLSLPVYDPAAMARRIDFTSWDNYETTLSGAAFNHDLVRGAKDVRQPTWTPEQRCAPPDNQPAVPLLRDGTVTALTLHNIACGSDATIYFRFEQALFGAENQHGGILDRTGGTSTRVHRELLASTPRIRKIGDAVAGAEVRAPVAIVLDPESSAAHTSPLPHGVKGRSTLIAHLSHLVRPYHRALSALGVDVDVIPPGRDLAHYSVVILAGQYLMTPDRAAWLRAYVDGGGCLVATPATAHLNAVAVLDPVPVPAHLDDVFGIEVREHDYLDGGQQLSLSGLGGRTMLTGMLSADLIECRDAEPRYEYAGAWYPQTAAITSRQAPGGGQAVYVGAILDEPSTRRVLQEILSERGVTWHELPPDVAVRRRIGNDVGHGAEVEYTFAVNLGDIDQTVDLGGDHRDLLTGRPITWPLTIAARDAVVMARPRA